MEKISADQIMLALRKERAVGAIHESPLHALPSSPENQKGGALPSSAPNEEGAASRPPTRQQASDAQIHNGSGIAFAAARVALLAEPANEIGAIILNHRGKQNAISIEAIIGLLWPEVVAAVSDRRDLGAQRAPLQESKHRTAERAVKAAVSLIFTVAKLDVGVSRGQPHGYYLMVTREEYEENAAETAKHALAWIERWKRFRPTPQAKEKFFEQAKLQFEGQPSVVSCQFGAPSTGAVEEQTEAR